MSQYIFLQVKEVIKETADAVTLIFTKPTVISSQFKPGQFLTLIQTVQGEKIRRSYSLSSSPFVEEDWAVTVKKVEGGKMSTHLVEKVKAGDIIESMVPAGIFTYEPVASNTKSIVLIGAGSGITPLCSILGSVLTKEIESKVYLLYGCRNEDSYILKRVVEDYQKRFPSRLFVELVYSQPNQSNYPVKGRLSKSIVLEKLKSFVGLDVPKALYYVCGPNGMMEETFLALQERGVPADALRKESFYAAPADHHAAPSQGAQEGAIEVAVKYNKQLYKIPVGSGRTILEAALDMGIDLPYSCQSGMCTACMGKCKTGKVEMDDPDGLSSNEIKQGFVLTCVGRPATNDVLIEID